MFYVPEEYILRETRLTLNCDSYLYIVSTEAKKKQQCVTNRVGYNTILNFTDATAKPT